MIRAELQVEKPVDVVFDYFADFRNENEWNVAAKDTRMTAGDQIGVGAKFAGDYEGMGMLEYTITEFQRPRFLRTKGTSARFDFDSTFSFEPSGQGTRVSGTMDPHPKGFFKLLSPLLPLMVKPQINKGFASLKEKLEAKP